MKTKATMGFAIMAAAALVLVVPIQAHHKQGHDGGTGQDDWPEGATGPFPLKEVLTDPIISFDGTPLESTIYIPDLSGLPKKVKAPVVLWSTPYLGECYYVLPNTALSCRPTSDSECVYEGCDPLRNINVKNLVEQGFAVAVVNVRGTGNSGGCFSFGGEDEQLDQVHLVEDLAARDWSNGRVAMYGLSYHGFTPWMAAIKAPEALKTIVPVSIVTNVYTFYHTPQGALLDISAATWGTGFTATINHIPPLGGSIEHGTVQHAEHVPGRIICPEAYDAISTPAVGQFTGVRDADFWDERRLDQHFGDIEAAVLVSHGHNDWGGGAFQEDVVWQMLPDDIPKRFILGSWGHGFPPSELIENAPFGSDWEGDVLFPWLDYFLKGQGDRETLRIGEIAYQSQEDLAWRTTTAWPPVDAREEVLYLSEQGLVGQPAAGSFTIVTPSTTVLAACRMSTEGWTGSVAMFATEPLTESVTIAGNPMAHLVVESTAPRGHVSVDLWVVGEDECPGDRTPEWWLTNGAASLGFHAGGYEAQNFPVGEPTPVRIDLFSESVALEPGDRLLLTVTGNGDRIVIGEPVFPVLTIHGGTTAEASHVVLPLVEGTLGGEAPSLQYPPRPFGPEDSGGA